MLNRPLDQLLNQNGTIVYLVVGLVVFAEDALFIGFLLPGETAAILGGVAASRGTISIVWMCVIVVGAAIIGDTIGYEVGARYGIRLLNLKVLRKRRDRIDAARALLARYGGPAVFFGRYIAFLRAIMPFLAGVSRMRYRRFLLFNALGGITWGLGSVLLGYLAGNSYTTIERMFGRVAAFAAAGLIVVAAIAWVPIRRRLRATMTDPGHDRKTKDNHDNDRDDDEDQADEGRANDSNDDSDDGSDDAGEHRGEHGDTG